MKLTRTTIRIQTDLKKAAEKVAIDMDTSFQDVVNRALEDFIEKLEEKKVKKIIFKTHDFGEPIDNLVRDDFYPEPKSDI